MAKGDPPVSPWVFDCQDYLDRHLTVTVPWDDTVTGTGTGNILDGVLVHRDVGCLYSTIVFSDPAQPIDLPPAPEGDTVLTAEQVFQATGFRTMDDINASGQVTAV